VISGVIYVVTLYLYSSRHRLLFSRAIFAVLAIMILGAMWRPGLFTSEERLFVLVPLCLNSILSSTASRSDSVNEESQEAQYDEKETPGSAAIGIRRD
jgi:hypothetical protein